MLACHFRDRVNLPKKSADLGSGLHQRDRAKYRFGCIRTHRKPGIFFTSGAFSQVLLCVMWFAAQLSSETKYVCVSPRGSDRPGFRPLRLNRAVYAKQAGSAVLQHHQQKQDSVRTRTRTRSLCSSAEWILTHRKTVFALPFAAASCPATDRH